MSALDLFRLDGKVALVTGGNRGLGRAMAGALLDAGAKVAILSRAKDEASKAAAELALAHGSKAVGLACDVTSEESVHAAVAGAKEALGHLDLLVNNAGMTWRGKAEEIAPEDFRTVYETNVTGTWLMCRAAFPHLRERGGGAIVNVASMLSMVGTPERSPYVASKGAVLQLTKALALEWAKDKIRVNALVPGAFLTDLSRAAVADPPTYQAIVSQTPLGRWGDPEDLRGAILFLCSAASAFVTGTGLVVDGGFTAH